jgi:putative transcriptional regulator
MSKVEKDLIRSMQEALAMAKGEPIGRYTHFPDPREVRRQAKLTQAEMAPLMGMSLSGYRKWEQGQRSVSGPALNLLRVMEKNPAAVMEALSNHT